MEEIDRVLHKSAVDRDRLSLTRGAERIALSLTGRAGTKEMLQTLAASAAFDMDAALREADRR